MYSPNTARVFLSAELDGRAREADERRIGQRVAHVPREAIDEVVLAAVRFVGDHDDVGALRQQRKRVPAGLREKLLDGREHHPPGGHLQQLAKVRPALRLLGALAQELGAAGEGPEELLVEVVAVGEHHQRRVLHRRVQHHAPRVERHRQALARALRVPHHAHAAAARRARRLDRGLDRATPRRETGGSPPASW
jgi:hypothetical protein